MNHAGNAKAWLEVAETSDDPLRCAALAQAEAILAVAYEQRTANKLAHLSLTASLIVMENVEVSDEFLRHVNGIAVELHGRDAE